MAKGMVPFDRRRVAAGLLEKGLREGVAPEMPKPPKAEKPEEPKDAIPELERLVKEWKPKTDEGKRYEKDVLELIKTLGGGKDSDFELMKSEKKKPKKVEKKTEVVEEEEY